MIFKVFPSRVSTFEPGLPSTRIPVLPNFSSPSELDADGAGRTASNMRATQTTAPWRLFSR